MGGLSNVTVTDCVSLLKPKTGLAEKSSLSNLSHILQIPKSANVDQTQCSGAVECPHHRSCDDFVFQALSSSLLIFVAYSQSSISNCSGPIRELELEQLVDQMKGMGFDEVTDNSVLFVSL